MVSWFVLASLPQFPNADTPGKKFRTIHVNSVSSTNFLSITNNQDPVIETNGAEPAPMDTNSNVGTGTGMPQSAIPVSGYTLDLTSGASPAADCDAALEKGRVKVDGGVGLLWVYEDSDWVFK